MQNTTNTEVDNFLLLVQENESNAKKVVSATIYATIKLIKSSVPVI